MDNLVCSSKLICCCQCFNLAFIFGSGCKIIGAISLSVVHRVFTQFMQMYTWCGKLQCSFHVNQRFELLFYECLNDSYLCSIICLVKYLQLNCLLKSTKMIFEFNLIYLKNQCTTFCKYCNQMKFSF